MNNLRRINLLPPEVGRERSQTKVRTIVIVGNAVLVVLLGLLYVMKVSAVSNARQELAVQQSKNQQVKNEINSPEFQTVVQKDQERTTRVQTLSVALEGEVSFPRLLNEFSLMIPNDVWLKSVSVDSGQAAQGATKGASAPAPAGAAGAGTSVEPTFQVEGAHKCDHDYTADWIDRMEALPSISSVWVSESTRQITPGVPCLTGSFTSSGQLSPNIQTVRSQMLAEGRLP